MPLDDGHTQSNRSVEKKPYPTFALAPQEGHLMPKGDELKFQAGAVMKAEREQ
jgi:hypothetical protein